jgi:hypothetical protein
VAQPQSGFTCDTPAGSINRLLTDALREQLNVIKIAELKSETEPDGSRAEVLASLHPGTRESRGVDPVHRSRYARSAARSRTSKATHYIIGLLIMLPSTRVAWSRECCRCAKTGRTRAKGCD